MENERKIEIEVDVKAEDYRRILFWYHWKRIAIVGLVWLLVFPLTIWFVAFGAGANPFESKDNSPLPVFAIFAMIPILIVVSFYFSIWRQAKKIEKISEKTSFVFSAMGFDSKNPSTSFQTTWERLNKIHETKSDFIFFPQENVFYTIPKRFFRNDEDIQKFKSLLRETLGKKAKLIK
jgi:heme/copper-type cytochrome/quinol oxidase subunit 2